MSDFVNFKLAQKLKEKGFNVPFYFYYRTDDKSLRHANVTNPLIYCDKIDDEVVIALTISQVLKWLREEKLFLIGLSPMQEYDVEETIEWCATVYKADKQGGLSLKEEFYYESYEQAALTGIEYVLDNLI